MASVGRRPAHLEEMVRELGTRGLVARIIQTRSGTSVIRVVNPEAASLSENVTCAMAPGSAVPYYYWSWGELMHRVDDPRGAATKVARVLAPAL